MENHMAIAVYNNLIAYARFLSGIPTWISFTLRRSCCCQWTTPSWGQWLREELWQRGICRRLCEDWWGLGKHTAQYLQQADQIGTGLQKLCDRSKITLEAYNIRIWDLSFFLLVHFSYSCIMLIYSKKLHSQLCDFLHKLFDRTTDTKLIYWSVFGHVSKHRERKLKNEAQPSFLTKVRGVWKHDQTLVRVFDTTSQTNTYFRRKGRRKFG